MPPVQRHFRVPRTARVSIMGTPGPAVQEIWVACHGYGQLAAPFAAALAPLEDPARLVLVPEALNRFYLDDPAKRHGPDSPVGAAWMTREDRERDIADYVDYLDIVVGTIRRELGDRRTRLVALGFSQGVATVSRWAVLGRHALDRLILWAGSPANDLPVDRGADLFRGAELTLVVGRGDPLVPLAAVERERAAMAARGLESTLLTFEGGHSLKSEILRQLAAAPQ